MKGLFYTVVLSAILFGIVHVWQQSQKPAAPTGPSIESLVDQLIASRSPGQDLFVNIVLSKHRGAREPLAIPAPKDLLARAKEWFLPEKVEKVVIPQYAWVLSQRPPVIHSCFDPVSATAVDHIAADLGKAMTKLGWAGMRANIIAEGDMAVPVTKALVSLADMTPLRPDPPVERFVGVGVSKEYLARLDPASFAHFVPPKSIRQWVVLWTPAGSDKVRLEFYSPGTTQPHASGEQPLVEDGPGLAALVQSVATAWSPEEIAGVRRRQEVPRPRTRRVRSVSDGRIRTRETEPQAPQSTRDYRTSEGRVFERAAPEMAAPEKPIASNKGC